MNKPFEVIDQWGKQAGCPLRRRRLGIWRVSGPGKPADAVTPPKSRGKGRSFAIHALPEHKSLLFSGHAGRGRAHRRQHRAGCPAQRARLVLAVTRRRGGVTPFRVTRAAAFSIPACLMVAHGPTEPGRREQRGRSLLSKQNRADTQAVEAAFQLFLRRRSRHQTPRREARRGVLLGPGSPATHKHPVINLADVQKY